MHNAGIVERGGTVCGHPAIAAAIHGGRGGSAHFSPVYLASGERHIRLGECEHSQQ